MPETIELILQRLTDDGERTFGVLINGLVPFAVTLEPPDKGNAINVSCIPPGRYTCRRVKSPKFGNVFEITGVPGHTHILFHWGNRNDDTLGCVLIAEEFGRYEDEPSVLVSKNDPDKGFNEFMKILNGVDEFIIDVRPAPMTKADK